MKTNTATIGITVKKVLTALVFIGMLGGISAGPARAEDGRGHHREHERDHRYDHDRDRHWHERHWRAEHGYPVYLAQPPVYGYAPPVVVYAPPPPPSVSFVFPLR